MSRPVTAVCFNLYEYRSGCWLIKAYLVGLDDRGRPAVVHQAATESTTAGAGIVPDEPLTHGLRLARSLRDRTVAARFREGARKAPVLAQLIAAGSKSRLRVLTYLHGTVAALLEHCRQHDYLVTANLDPRASPLPYLVTFEATARATHLSFALEGGELTHRLRVADQSGKTELTIRQLDPQLVTDRPTPAWLLADGRLIQLDGLAGEAIRPFLVRDALAIPAAEVTDYLREVAVRSARDHDLSVTGLALHEVTVPDGMRLVARLHPFEQRYYLYPEFVYGPHTFLTSERTRVAVSLDPGPPYVLTRARRDPERETAWLQQLTAAGLTTAADGGSYTLPDSEGRYDNLAWLIEHRGSLEERGIEIDVPQEEGRDFSTATGQLSVEVAEIGDWLDLKGRVTVGQYSLSFARLVGHLRRGERRFPLPDGTFFLLPAEWLATYGARLELARVSADSVRLARSQAPLLKGLGLSLPEVPSVEDIPPYAPDASLRARLRPYQLTGVQWLVDHYHRRLGACLADDMGLGKTLQTIAVLLYAKQRQPATGGTAARQTELFAPAATDEEFLRPLRALIVLPASLVYNWTSELRRFAPSLTVHVHTGTKRSRDPRILRRHDVLLTTYQTALRDRDILAKVELSYIVLDESQQIKNRQSKVFRALDGLAAPHRISLSGTPIENSLADLWSQMQFINPGLLGTFSVFRKQYILPIEQHDHPAKKARLRELVGPHLLRRTKREVAPDLPELEVQTFYCSMTDAQQRAYDRERTAARNALLGIGEPTGGDYKLLVIQALTRLRQLANHPVIADAEYAHDSGKFEEVTAQLDTLHRAGHKVLVFSSMVRQLELYRAHLLAAGGQLAWLTGSVAADRRAAEVERFQTEPAVLTFLISIKAGGTGLNLTAADYVFLLDPWWNPTTEEQAIARAHRIGRAGKVFARRFLTRGSLEEKIYRLQLKKKRLAGEIIDRGSSLDFDEREIEFLLT